MTAGSSGEQSGVGGEVRLVHLTKRFGELRAVDDLSLTIPEGSFFALLGPSGCGKTTTLRMIGGLERPTSGRVLIGDDDVTDRKPYKRPVNTVFQSYALFPHLDIFENVAFGLKRRGVKDVRRPVEEMLELVELPGYASRRPSQLSGGQQQRVALARALINRPRVLLLDEPLGALDLKLRRQMQIELKRIQLEVGITFVHVTHDQEEAMTMADTVALMNGGVVEQMGAPEDLYESPATPFAASFLGQSNLFGAVVTGRSGGDLLLDAQGHHLTVPAGRAASDGPHVLAGVRPEKMHLLPAARSREVPAAADRLPGVVTDSSFTGVSTQYLVRVPWGQELTVFVQNSSGRLPVHVGDEVVLHWHPEHTFALSGDGASGRAADPAEAEDPAPAVAR